MAGEPRRGSGIDDAMSAARATIVHVITQLELGGAQQNTLDTCARLDRSRFDVVLLAGEGGYLDAAAARIDALDFRSLKNLVRPISPAIDRAGYRELRGHLESIRASRPGPMIVHTHSTKAGMLGRLAARAAGADAIVHTIHGFGHPALANPLLRCAAILAEKWLAPRTDRFLAVSRANIEEGERLGLFARTPVELVRSGFDLDAFRAKDLTRSAARAALDLDPYAPLVGMVACLKPQKAPLDFAAIAALVAGRHPGVRFVLAGDGELRGALESRLRALGIADRFTLLGWRDDVPRVLRALDVFVLTSRWEGLPRSVAQAMASGVPVVATAVDGTRDVVRDAETGFAIAPGDVEHGARRVLELLADDALRARLAAAAARNVAEFDVDLMVRAQERIYESLLAARPLPGAPASRR